MNMRKKKEWMGFMKFQMSMGQVYRNFFQKLIEVVAGDVGGLAGVQADDGVVQVDN